VTGPYTAAERRALARALARGESPGCPTCGAPVTLQEVERPANVSYVRHRVWVLCPSCKRTGAVDVEPPPGG
jgi:uncharacterized protein with PIN domain